MKLFESLTELASSGYVFRIQDNGGASADRYTVVFCDGDYLALSSYPSHPQGVSQFGEGIDPATLSEWDEKGEAVDLALGDLPQHIQDHILARVNQAWADWLEAIERRDPNAVAPSRDQASENEGLYNSGGTGIYLKNGQFYVKRDGDEADDLGPYATAREALVATLPEGYSLSGPEYHSPENVGRLEPSVEVKAQVEALEAAVEAKRSARMG